MLLFSPGSRSDSVSSRCEKKSDPVDTRGHAIFRHGKAYDVIGFAVHDPTTREIIILRYLVTNKITGIIRGEITDIKNYVLIIKVYFCDTPNVMN